MLRILAILSMGKNRKRTRGNPQLMSKTRNLNTHKFGSSRYSIRLHIIRGRYENHQGVLRISKEFSTVIIIYKQLLRVMRILQIPRSKTKIVVVNHNLKKNCLISLNILIPIPNIKGTSVLSFLNMLHLRCFLTILFIGSFMCLHTLNVN